MTQQHLKETQRIRIDTLTALFICKLIFSDSVLTTQAHSIRRLPLHSFCHLRCQRMPLPGRGRLHCWERPRVFWKTEKACFRVMATRTISMKQPIANQ